MASRTLELAAIGAGLTVAAVLVYKGVTAGAQLAGAAVDGAAGLVTGDNAITRNQTNAAGEKVTAYEGAGVLGTLGAAANSVSGGMFATWGQSLGGWFYDATHDDPIATATAPGQPAPTTATEDRFDAFGTYLGNW